jgi:hypothetical protein
VRITAGIRSATTSIFNSASEKRNRFSGSTRPTGQGQTAHEPRVADFYQVVPLKEHNRDNNRADQQH